MWFESQIKRLIRRDKRVYLAGLNSYIVEDAKQVSSCFSLPSRARPLLSCKIKAFLRILIHSKQPLRTAAK